MSIICIWCRKIEPDVTFVRAAHIFPHSLGGIRVCKNVCDSCNLYFGSKQKGGVTSVEIALKELLNISRYFLLGQTAKKLPRFQSEYFNYDFKKQILKPKFKYSAISDFQAMFTKQFKRGVYKIFLEERSESIGDALNSQFDFIREYARYGIGDYPVFYCKPTFPVIFLSKIDVVNPIIRFTEYSENIMKQFGFYNYYFFTHNIAFPVIRNYEITISNYVKFVQENEKNVCADLIPIKQITDIDFTFSFLEGSR